MAIHVGLEAWHGKLSYYNETETLFKFFYLDMKVDVFDIDKINLLYEEIISKIEGNFGCLCIYLNWNYGNKIREKFIEFGYKYGFTNVEIINFHTTLYLTAMSIINYKPKNNEIIWIQYNAFFNVWKINDKKAEFIGQWDLDDTAIIIYKTQRNPDIVLTDEDFTFDICEYKGRLFTYYKIPNFENQGAFIKARFTAGDQQVAHLGTVNFSSQIVIVKFNEEEIFSFKRFQKLPVTYSQMLKRKTNCNVLEIISGFDKNQCFTLPDSDQIYFTLKIDSNEIYSIIFDELQDTLTQDTKCFTTNNNKLMPLSTLISELSLTELYTIPIISTITKNHNHVIGIDLGTSRCCAAVNRINGIVTFPLDNIGERLLPSYVAYNEEKPSFGQVAVNRLRNHSKSTIFDSKRIIGRNFDDIGFDSNWDFTVYFENDQVYIEVNGFDGRKKITAIEVAADLLKYIKNKAEEFQGCKLTNVVITVPTVFNDLQKTATIKAAHLAGWSNIKLLPEPIAAAFAYFITRPIPNNTNILLFDLGGGTLDVCVFKIENNQIKILSNTGDTKLGGRDFDKVLINHFKNALSTDHGITNLKDKKYKLMLECQKIKQDLSAAISTSLGVCEFDTRKEGIIPINREEFRQMSQILLNKIKNTIQSALFQSNYKPEQINKVLQVGGGSRMPMIKQLLLKMFPKADHICEEHPDEVVAIGAAYYAYHVFSNH